MIGALIRLVLAFFFPRILILIINLVKNRHQLSKVVKLSIPSDCKSLLLSMPSLILALYSILSLLGLRNQPNYFRETLTPLNSPAYLIRNSYRDFIEKLGKTDINFNEYISSVPPQTSFTDHVDFDPKFEQVRDYLVQLESLSLKLRLKENILLYSSFGDYAFNNCEFCDKNDSLNYLLFVIPSIGFSYIKFMLALGLLTLIGNKRQGFKCGVILCIIALIHDGLNFYMFMNKSDMLLYDWIFPSGSKSMLNFEKLEFVRSLIFAIALLFSFFIEIPERLDQNLVRLRETLSSLQELVDQFIFTQLSRAAILNEDSLRKAYFEYMKTNQFAPNDDLPTAVKETFRRTISKYM